MICYLIAGAGLVLAMICHIRASFWKQSYERAAADYKALLAAYNNIPRTRRID